MAINLGLNNIKSAFDEMDARYDHSDEFLGKSILTIANMLSSSRGLMFSAHLEQFVNLVNPEIPKVYTGYENVVGEFSTSYLRADSDYDVFRRIVKYPCPDAPELETYVLVVYNRKTGYWDIIEKKHSENLTETYGYTYNSSVIDSLDEGNVIPQDTVLYNSNSFDEAMNYRYGVNAKCVYLIENFTLEDAYVVSESLAKKLVSHEVEEVKVNLNDNDIFINLYGDKNNYKSFPDIGEEVRNKIVAAKRRINYSQALFDLKDENITRINRSIDTPLSVAYKGRMVDIDIFANKEIEDIDDPYHHQIIKYMVMQEKYYQDIYDTLGELIANGNDCTDGLLACYNYAKLFLDKSLPWQDAGSVYNNMIVRFTVVEESKITKGSKICGRYGDKGVISEVRPDHLMPKLDDGTYVDLICNSLGVVNRLNPSQLYECEINFIGNRVIEHLRTKDNVKEIRESIFKFIKIINPKQYEFVKNYYMSLGDNGKAELINDYLIDGIHINIPPFWNDLKLEIVDMLYREFPYVQKYKATVFKHGREIPLLNDIVAGEKYIIKLKHSPRSKYSARSTGHLNIRDLPEKSNNSKNNTSLYAKTPVRLILAHVCRNTYRESLLIAGRAYIA